MLTYYIYTIYSCDQNNSNVVADKKKKHLYYLINNYVTFIISKQDR